jgi:hypothetical protein
MNMPFLGAADFLGKQLETLMVIYAEWQQQKEAGKHTEERLYSFPLNLNEGFKLRNG